MPDESLEQRAKLLAKHRRSKTPLTIAPPKKPRWPKNVGDRIDALYAFREEVNALSRLAGEAERLVKALRDEQDEVAKSIARDLGSSHLRLGRGADASFSPGSKPVILVHDWEAFYDYIRKQDAFECLHRRVTTDAVVERLDRGEAVPGVTREAKFSYSLTKVGKR